MSQPHDRFHPFECEFDLPSEAVKLEHSWRFELIRQRRPYEEILGRLPGLWAHDLLLFASVDRQSVACQSRGLRTAFECYQTSGDPSAGGVSHLRTPLLDLSYFQFAEQSEYFALISFFIKNWKRLPIQSH